MNTYVKYCPNVYVAKCDSTHEKGDIIIVTTRYGKENECIVHNLVAEKNGSFFYSITRADGFNAQEHAARRAHKYEQWSENAEKRSDDYYKKSNKDREFLSLGEPIKVGHHSERRHRKIIEDARRNMGKSIEEDQKAERLKEKAEYWHARENDINLSMPESIEFFRHKVEVLKDVYEKIKSGEIPREHSFSLEYARKDYRNAEKNLEIAIKLWG